MQCVTQTYLPFSHATTRPCRWLTIHLSWQSSSRGGATPSTAQLAIDWAPPAQSVLQQEVNADVQRDLCDAHALQPSRSERHVEVH